MFFEHHFATKTLFTIEKGKKKRCGFVADNYVCVLSYPAPERAVDTEGDCGGVPPISFPYGPADGGVGEDRMLVLTPIASSESTASWVKKKSFKVKLNAKKHKKQKNV